MINNDEIARKLIIVYKNGEYGGCVLRIVRIRESKIERLFKGVDMFKYLELV